MGGRGRAALIAAGLLLYTAFFYADILFQYRVVVFRDQYTILLAVDWVTRLLSEWSWPPLWTPFQILGKPLVAEPVAGVYYPLNWAFRLLPFPFGYNASVAVHHVLGAAGTYALLRYRGAAQGSAVFGGLLFAFGGMCVGIDNMLNALQAATWLPWTLLAFDAWCVERDARYLAGTAVGMALTLLGGMPETYICELPLCLALALDRRRAGGPTLMRAGVATVVAAALGLGLAALQMFPTLECVALSPRAAGLRTAGVVRLSLTPLGTLAFLLPRHFVDAAGAFHETAALWEAQLSNAPWALTLYLGPLLILMAGLRVPPAQRGLWLAVLAAFLILAWGDHVPGFTSVVDRMPLLRSVRYPEKFLVVVHLLLVVAAGLGLDAACREPARFRRVAAAAVACATICAVVVLLMGSYGSLPLEVLRRDLMVSTGLLLLIAALAWVGMTRPALALVGCIALGAIDLYRVNGRLLPTLDWQEIRRVPESVRVMARGDDPLRIYSDSLGRPDVAPFPDSMMQEQRLLLFEIANYYGIANLNAPASINLSDHERLSELIEGVAPDQVATVFGAFSTAYVTSPKDLRRYPGLTPILTPQTPVDSYVYRVEGSSPRVFVPETIVAVANNDDAFAYLRTAKAPAKNVALVAADVPADLPPTMRGEVKIASYLGDEVVLDARMATNGVVVLTDTFYPGWEATIDGKPAPILRANYFVRGVFVPQGEHRIVFAYRPGSHRLGLIVSAVSAIILLGMMVIGRREGSS